jgi:hypothetical protein
MPLGAWQHVVWHLRLLGSRTQQTLLVAGNLLVVFLFRHENLVHV